MSMLNDQDLSDRILRIEITADTLDSMSNSVVSDHGHCVSQPGKRNLRKKQKRQNLKEKEDADVKVITLHLSSGILAMKSPFFYKLFKNGMIESQEKVVTLRITSSEEAALMDLLNYMYNNPLSATTAPELVAVMVVADKFEVSSCARHCYERLKKIPPDLMSMLLCIGLPSSVDVFQPLILDAKEFLATRASSLIQEEASIADFPLSAIEAVLGSDDLEVDSEEEVYAFILKWGRAHYPKQRTRQEVLTDLVGRFLYFPYLNMSTLREIQGSSDFDSNRVSKLVMESLYLNAGFRYGERKRLAPVATSRCRFRRKYRDFPVKAVEIDSSCLVVYLNIMKDECRKLRQAVCPRSQKFILGGQTVFLWCKGGRKVNCFSVHLGRLGLRDGGNEKSCKFDYELAVAVKKLPRPLPSSSSSSPSSSSSSSSSSSWLSSSSSSSSEESEDSSSEKEEEEEEEFKVVYKLHNCTLSESQCNVGWDNTFGIPWRDFMADNSTYFIQGVLHLRAKFFTTNNSGQ